MPPSASSASADRIVRGHASNEPEHILADGARRSDDQQHGEQDHDEPQRRRQQDLGEFEAARGESEKRRDAAPLRRICGHELGERIDEDDQDRDRAADGERHEQAAGEEHRNTDIAGCKRGRDRNCRHPKYGAKPREPAAGGAGARLIAEIGFGGTPQEMDGDAQDRERQQFAGCDHRGERRAQCPMHGAEEDR
jgi:hypothetical protein